MQKLLLIGNLGSAPDMRYSQSGIAMVSFSLATNEQWTDKQGQKQKRTEWHNIKAFGKQAETMEKYLSKGDTVFIEGQLETRSYEKDGETKYITDVKVREFKFLPSDKKETGGANKHKAQERTPMEDPAQPMVDDDLPF